MLTLQISVCFFSIPVNEGANCVGTFVLLTIYCVLVMAALAPPVRISA